MPFLFIEEEIVYMGWSHPFAPNNDQPISRRTEEPVKLTESPAQTQRALSSSPYHKFVICDETGEKIESRLACSIAR